MRGLGTRKAGARSDGPDASMSAGQSRLSLPILAVADFFNHTFAFKGDDTFLLQERSHGTNSARLPRIRRRPIAGGRGAGLHIAHPCLAGDGLARRQAILGLLGICDSAQSGIQCRRDRGLSPQQDRVRPADTGFATSAQQSGAVSKISVVGCWHQGLRSRQDLQIHHHAGPRHWPERPRSPTRCGNDDIGHAPAS